MFCPHPHTRLMGPGALRADDPAMRLAPTSLIGKVDSEPGHRAICDIFFSLSLFFFFKYLFGYAES